MKYIFLVILVVTVFSQEIDETAKPVAIIEIPSADDQKVNDHGWKFDYPYKYEIIKDSDLESLNNNKSSYNEDDTESAKQSSFVQFYSDIEILEKKYDHERIKIEMNEHNVLPDNINEFRKIKVFFYINMMHLQYADVQKCNSIIDNLAKVYYDMIETEWAGKAVKINPIVGYGGRIYQTGPGLFTNDPSNFPHGILPNGEYVIREPFKEITDVKELMKRIIEIGNVIPGKDSFLSFDKFMKQTPFDMGVAMIIGANHMMALKRDMFYDRNIHYVFITSDDELKSYLPTVYLDKPYVTECITYNIRKQRYDTKHYYVYTELPETNCFSNWDMDFKHTTYYTVTKWSKNIESNNFFLTRKLVNILIDTGIRMQRYDKELFINRYYHVDTYCSMQCMNGSCGYIRCEIPTYLLEKEEEIRKQEDNYNFTSYQENRRVEFEKIQKEKEEEIKKNQLNFKEKILGPIFVTTTYFIVIGIFYFLLKHWL